MIRGDEEKCPRCDLPLAEVSVICPVCGEKMQFDAKSCPNCRAEFEDKMAAPKEITMPDGVSGRPEAVTDESVEPFSAEAVPEPAKPAAARMKKPAKAKPRKKPAKKPASTKGKSKPVKKAAPKSTKSSKGAKTGSQKRRPSKGGKKK